MNRKTPADMSTYASPSPRPSPSGRYVFTVAQIFNLPYRRFVIGRASDRSQAPWFPDVWQSATLRYSRLQVCATGVGNSVNRYSWRGRRRVLETPEWSCSTTIPSASNQDAVTNTAISKLSERVDGRSPNGNSLGRQPTARCPMNFLFPSPQPSPLGRGRPFRRFVRSPSALFAGRAFRPLETLARCSLSPRERVRVRGNELNVSIRTSELETHPPALRIPILFESSGFAPRICIIA